MTNKEQGKAGKAGVVGKLRKTQRRWKTEMAFQLYELAALGASYAEIARAMDVDVSTVPMWLRDNELAATAYRCGKAKCAERGSESGTFAEYIYGRLPVHCQEAWDRLAAAEKAEDAPSRVAALLAPMGTAIRKHLFLYALVHSSFNTSEAMRRVGVSRKALNNWMQYDPEFAELADEIQYHKKNFFEARLVDLAAAGDSGAVVFANRTLNRDRGYNDRFELQLSGTVNVNHTVVAVDTLDLPLEVRQLILERMRSRKGSMPAVNRMPEAPDELPPDEDARSLTVVADFWDDSP